MAWSQDDLDKLEAAIATGARRVRYKDGEIEYNSPEQMQSTRKLMRKELGLTTKRKRRAPSFSKGLTDDGDCGC